MSASGADHALRSYAIGRDWNLKLPNIFLIPSFTAGPEDRFTASLHYLIDCFPSIGQRIVDAIADRTGLPRSSFVAAEDHPQGNEESKPDFKLICRDYEILCEHKIACDLEHRQLERYVELIESWPKPPDGYLVLITNRHHTISEKTLLSSCYRRPHDSKVPYFLWESFFLHVAAEGGGLDLVGCRKGDRWMFRRAVRDWTPELLGEDWIRHESGSVSTWVEALELLDHYPWHQLSATFVHPAFRDAIFDAVVERYGEYAGSAHSTLGRWRRICLRVSD